MGNVSKKYELEYTKRATTLVEQMTLEEKVSQMLFESPAIERLGIKEYCWWNEALHGVARAGTATVFPQAIALGATFDEELLKKIGDVISTEARAKYNASQAVQDCGIYKGLTYWSPNVNIFRDPRWGRGHETYGEDPYLTSRLGVAFINGLQGNDERYLKAAACAKHYAVHSGPESLRQEFNAICSDTDLYETYLPAFEACVKEALVEGVMGAYNRTNGEPCCGSKTLLLDILRNKWGFNRYVTSDCGAIAYFHEYHKVTSNPRESVALAVSSSCDLNCGSLYKHLVDAVNDGLLPEKFINESVVRLLTTRMKLGEFDSSEDVPFSKIPYSVVDCDEHRRLNYEAAKKCLVLLKNKDGFLPLDKKKYKTIGVIGPNANNRVALRGNYCGVASRWVTVVEGIQDYFEKDGGRVLFSEGCHHYKDFVEWSTYRNDRFDEINAICKESDVIIGCFGLDELLEGEAGSANLNGMDGDKPDLRLPGIQNEIIAQLSKYGKPVILVLLTGSAIDITKEEQDCDAVIQGWYGGSLGGKAIAEMIFGEFSPEGKLPITFYSSENKLPDFTDYSMINRTYRYMTDSPLYPFGYGLSYTSFELSSVDKAVSNEGVKLFGKVKNVGTYDSTFTLQAYVKSSFIGTPNAQLKGISKIKLASGEEKDFEIFLPMSAFMLCNSQGESVLYNCEYTVYISDGAPCDRTAELTGKKPLEFKVRFD